MAASRERQPSLFPPGFEALEQARREATVKIKAAVVPRDPNVTEVADKRRLSGQSARILARLREGPATNAELAGLALKYTSRLSDIRSFGCEIGVERKAGGTFVYTLVHVPEGL